MSVTWRKPWMYLVKNHHHIIEDGDFEKIGNVLRQLEYEDYTPDKVPNWKLRQVTAGFSENAIEELMKILKADD